MNNLRKVYIKLEVRDLLPPPGGEQIDSLRLVTGFFPNKISRDGEIIDGLIEAIESYLRKHEIAGDMVSENYLDKTLRK